MPPDADDRSVNLMMEMLIKHDELFTSLGRAIDSMAESVVALTERSARQESERVGLSDELLVGHTADRGRVAQDPRWHTGSAPDPSAQAVLTHYDQLRSDLGRSGAAFYVGVLRLDDDVIALSGTATALADVIRVGGSDTYPGSDWSDDGRRDVLVSRRTDIGGVEDGTSIECWSGGRLVAVGTWPPATSPYGYDAREVR